MSLPILMPVVHQPTVTGRVVRIRRQLGHFARKGEPVADIMFTDVFTLTICAPFDGRIIRCAEIDAIVKPGDLVAEFTTVGRPTWELFVAYRRNDAPGHAHRIGAHLIETFGPGQVFKDVESLTVGDDFPAIIREKLQQASVMTVVVGPKWAQDRRLHDARDLHREEIRTALERKIHIFPVLVDGASVPPPDSLPEDVRPLFNRIALPLHDTAWAEGMKTLESALTAALLKSERRDRFLAQVPASGGWQLISDPPLE